MKVNNSWFTLVEMLIAITIFILIVMFTYVNYAYYQNIASVKIWIKEVSQTIREARNMAVNWLNIQNTNQDTFVYFDFDDNRSITIYSADFNIDDDVNFDYEWSFDFSKLNKIKKRELPRWVQIDSSWDKNILLRFKAISWEGIIYNIDRNNPNDISNTIDNEIYLDISFRWASFWPLHTELKYFKNTNMIDY